IQPITVPITDDDIIEATEQFFVDLSNLVTNTPITITDNQATVDIIDNDNIPGVTGISFDNDSVVVNEGDGTATINVLLTGNVQGGVTVDYTTTDNTAEEASDYTLTTGTLTFVGTDGEIQPITVPITDDDIIEATEQFFVDLSNLVTNTPITITDNQATVDILDNDNIPGVTGITINDITVNEESGTATLTATLTGNVQGGVTVDFNTVDDTAFAGEDFEATTSSVSFIGTDGETQEVVIPIINDVLLEDDESFFVVLSNLGTNTPITIIDDTGIITIIDDEYDTDGDTIPDIVDYDDDNDGILDEDEDDGNTDTDNDGYADSIDIDSDNDGIPDNVEAQSTAGYIPPTGNDSDNDGLDDAYEGTTGNEGITLVDTDNDGTFDFRDLDSDNDNVPDNNEGNDFNFDGEPDQFFTGTDTDGDGLDDGYEGSDVNDGFDVNDEIDDPANDLPDTDGIDDVNYRDIDDDGDGVPTIDEDPDNDGDPTNNDTDGDGTPDYLDPVDDRFRDPNFEDITIICGDEIPAIPELGDVGGCDDEPTVVFTEETIFFDDTADYMIERTWELSDSCGNTGTYTQTIFIMQEVLEEIYLEICVEDDPIDLYELIPEGYDNTGTFTSITPGTYLNNTQFVPNGLEPGEYRVAYSAIDGPCIDEVEFIVTVDKDCVDCDRDAIQISKVVTPNGDFINDVFEITGTDYCDFTFDVMIFNRWGDKVYEAKEYQNDWGGVAPGNSFGTSGVLPAGTYYYIITIVGAQMEPLNGYIYLNTGN
ncbi:gliding motility-associated C-terminal domain-containing protein, partial [Croceivirga lutea]|uniref:gliding motility-associated C-terminal domain-containing protein n=1 Tax=Croceivirga lutea TaxID=1775167 RepID=UPI00163AE91D